MQKELLLNVSKLFISKLIPAFVMILIYGVYSRELTQFDYGIYQKVWTFLNVFIVLSVFGIPKYILVIGNSLNKKRLKNIFKLFLIVFTVIFLIIAFYIFGFTNYFDVESFGLFMALLLSQAIYLIQESYVIAKDKSKRLLWSNTAYALLLFSIHMLVVYTGYNLDYCLLGILLVSVFRNILLWKILTSSLLLSNNAPLEESQNFSLIIWLGINDTLQILTKYLDKLVLLFILSAAEFAIYYNGTFELPLVGMALLAFQSIVTVQAVKNGANIEYRLKLFRSSSLFMSSIMFPLFSWIFFYASPIVTVLFSTKYEDSAQLFALSALVLPMRICDYILLLQLKNQGRIILTGSIIDLIISLSLMGLLYPFFQLKGLVLGLVIGTYIQSGYYLIQTTKIYNVSLTDLLPFQKLIIRLLLIFITVGVIKYLGDGVSSIFGFILGTFVSGVIALYYLKKSYSSENINFNKMYNEI